MALTNIALVLALLASTGGGEPDGSALPFSVFPTAVGDNFGTKESLYRVFRSPTEFLSDWPRDGDCDANCAKALIAPVDFDRDMLVVIAPRGRGQNTYDVVVTAVIANQGSIDVTFLELRHGEPTGDVLCGVKLTAPAPAVALLTSQSDKPVRFFRSRADVICEHAVQVH